MQSADERSGKRKKKYSRPTLRQVPLRPEEAVLGSCKTSSSAGANIGGFSGCTIPQNCSAPGS